MVESESVEKDGQEVMYLSNFKRRVRIESGMDDLAGWHVHIIDVETGEAIQDITKAVITLIPGEYNSVEFTYLERREGYSSLAREETIRVHHPEIALTAYEREEREES